MPWSAAMASEGRFNPAKLDKSAQIIIDVFYTLPYRLRQGAPRKVVAPRKA
jgi:hypothetical protein